MSGFIITHQYCTGRWWDETRTPKIFQNDSELLIFLMQFVGKIIAIVIVIVMGCTFCVVVSRSMIICKEGI